MHIGFHVTIDEKLDIHSDSVARVTRILFMLIISDFLQCIPLYNTNFSYIRSLNIVDVFKSRNYLIVILMVSQIIINMFLIDYSIQGYYKTFITICVLYYIFGCLKIFVSYLGFRYVISIFKVFTTGFLFSIIGNSITDPAVNDESNPYRIKEYDQGY